MLSIFCFKHLSPDSKETVLFFGYDLFYLTLINKIVIWNKLANSINKNHNEVNKMIKKKSVNFIIGCFLLLICNYLTAFFLKSSIFLVMTLLVISIIYMFKSDPDTLEFFIIYTVLQNFTLIIFAGIMTRTETQLIILIKESLVYIYALIYFVRLKIANIKKIDVVCIIFMLYSIINLLLISPSMRSGVVGLRQILVIFACFYFGMAIKNLDEKKIDYLFNFIIKVAVIIAIIGFVIWFLPDNIWENMGYGEYWHNKYGTTKYSYSNFYTYDFGPKLKRMVSIFADPLACSHFFGIALVILFTKYKKRFFEKTVIVLALAMGMSKATILLVVSMILVKYYTKITNKLSRYIFIMCLGGGALFCFFYLSNYTASLSQNTSIGNHFSSFLYGLQNITLFGNGYGTAGYNVKTLGTTIDTKATESFFATCVLQCGLVGVILIYGFLLLLIFHLFKNYYKTKNNLSIIAIILIISIIVESFVSASSVSMLGTGLYFIIVGMIYNMKIVNQNNDYGVNKIKQDI